MSGDNAFTAHLRGEVDTNGAAVRQSQHPGDLRFLPVVELVISFR